MGNVFYFANIVLFLIAGAATSYGDVFRKKVVNTWLVWTMRNALIVFAFFFILSLISVQQLLPVSLKLFQLTLFRDILINSVGAAAVACSFWYLGIWAAGDAKLFILCAFLIPLPFYSGAYIKYVPSFIFLVNTFIPVFLYVFFMFMLHIIGRGISWCGTVVNGNVVKGFAQLKALWGARWREHLALIFGVLSFFWFLGLLQDLLQGVLRPFIPLQAFFFVLFLLGRNVFQKIFSFKAVQVPFVVVFVLLLSFGLFYEPNRALELFLSSMTLSISLFIVISLVNALFNSYVEDREVRVLPIDELSDHMLLAARSEFVLKRDKAYCDEHVGRLYPDGLLPEQVAPVKSWFKKEGIKTVEIYKTFPFAPFIFLGGILTLLFQGSPFLPLGIALFKGLEVSFGLNLIGFLFPTGGM